MPEFGFLSNFEIKPEIGSHRLPTHKRGAHRKFGTLKLHNLAR